MRSTLRRFALTVFLIAGVVACGRGAGAVNHTVVVAQPPRLSDVIQLTTTQVVGGQPIQGALAVSNPGGAIDLNPHGCRPEFTIVLTTGTSPPAVAWPAICAAGPFLIPHGATRLAVSVATTYPACLQPGGSGAGLPPCSGAGPPPLPPGPYRAVVVWNTLAPPLPVAQPVSVTVLAKRS
jgi:hypothetical protein